MKKNLTKLGITILFILWLMPGYSIDAQVNQLLPPLRLTAHNFGNLVQINWQPRGQESGYYVYRSVTNHGPWIKLNEQTSHRTVFCDLSPSKETVFYSISSIDSQGRESNLSESIKIAPVSYVLPRANFNQNNIISDAQMTDYNSLSQQQIQDFLVSKGSALAGYSCPAHDNGPVKSAAQQIYEACQASQISPWVILTTLQKEQSLILSGNLDGIDLAMGWDVPNNFASHNFGDQIYWGTHQFRLYINNLGNYGWAVGVPHDVEGGTVTPENTATAALYIYTPVIGNPGGNYLFWSIWNNWNIIIDDFTDIILRRCYERNGGGEHFGQSVNDKHRWGNPERGWIQEYNNNGIPSAIALKDEFSEAYSVWGDIWKYYSQQVGGCDGSLGWPVSSGYPKDQVDAWEWDIIHDMLLNHGCLTRFEHGTIYEHLVGPYITSGLGGLGCFHVYGDINIEYDHLGGSQSDLGFPIENQHDAAISQGAGGVDKESWCTRGCLSRFEYGAIYEHLNGAHEHDGYDNRGAFEVHGGIYRKHDSMGGTCSTALGFPISDEEDARVSAVSGKSGRYNLFEGGTINKWDGGTFAVYGKICDKFRELDYSGSPLGFPVADSTNSNTRQDFEGGYIYVENGTAKVSYNTRPVVTGIYPASGSNDSITQVTIIGSHFSNVSSVKLGNTQLALGTYSSTQILATIPAGQPVGTYDITVTTDLGTSEINNNSKFAAYAGGDPISVPTTCLKIVLNLPISTSNNPTPHPPTTDEKNQLDRNQNGQADVGDVVLILQQIRKKNF